MTFREVRCVQGSVTVDYDFQFGLVWCFPRARVKSHFGEQQCSKGGAGSLVCHIRRHTVSVCLLIDKINFSHFLSPLQR